LNSQSHIDEGVWALALTLQVLGLAADPAQIKHKSGLQTPMAEVDLLRAARAFPVKAKAIGSSVKRLNHTPLPAIALMREGGFLVLGQVNAEGVLAQGLHDERPMILGWDQFEAVWTRRLILVTRRAAISDLHRRFDLSWFWGAIHKYRRILYEVLIASFFIQIFALVTPMIFQVVIDKVLVHRGLSTLQVLVAGLALVSFFDVILGGLRSYIFAHTSNRIDVELGARIYRHLIQLPLAYFQARRVGDSVARVRELETIRQFLTGSALTLVLDLFFGIIFIAVMFIYSPTLAWIVVATLPFYAALAAVVTPVFRARLEEKFRHGAENQAFLVESVTGIETIKAMAVEPVVQRQWEEQLASYVGSSFKTQTLGMIANQSTSLISKVTTIVTLFVGARLVIDNQLTVGELVAFNMLSGQVTGPVLRLAQLWQDFNQVKISVDRLGDILNTQPEPSPSSQDGQGGVLKGDIRLEHITFRYRPDAQPILSDLSLDIPSGQVIGVVGPSGSGKSTIAKLIQRLYVPEQGRLLVDGRDIALADPAWLRRQIGVVLQENVLFNRTVRENIALANPATPIDEVIAAAELAGAHEFIAKMTRGYDTMIGERGASLSGGQRQRIAIARALLGNPRILIFDEATSALDYESESIIQRNMRQIVEGRTVVIIAHRLSTVRGADRIITIEDGRIVEDGTHESLLHAHGRYASLHQLQSDVGR
jgi:ATP-binding cassette, subfamily B, bacterial HlyB/CyaB